VRRDKCRGRDESGIMKIKHMDDDGARRVLRIEADWSEIAEDYEDIVAAYKKIRVPGFRPGKAPRTVIEKRFQKEIMDDLSQRASQRLSRQAVREAGIEVLGPAEAEELECVKDRPFRATVRFHPMPKIELPDLEKLTSGDADMDASAVRKPHPSKPGKEQTLSVNPEHVPPLMVGSVEEVDLRDRISLRLLDLVPFDVPDGIVRDELALDGEDGVVPGSAEWKVAKDRIRLMLILKQIAKQEGIEVDPADVDHRIAEKAEEFGTTTKALQAELSQGNGMQRLKDVLLAESTLAYLAKINT
jgi:FKBP-type peptidyl-prolyl cis-trans isomerase (trigger factor)